MNENRLKYQNVLLLMVRTNGSPLSRISNYLVFVLVLCFISIIFSSTSFITFKFPQNSPLTCYCFGRLRNRATCNMLQIARFLDDKESVVVDEFHNSHKLHSADQLEYDNVLKLYRFKGKLIMWTFWDFRPMPPYVKLSLLTLQCHNPNITLIVLNRRSAKKLMPLLHPAFRHLTPNLKSDYIRAILLLFFGGIWIDADTIGWGSIGYQFDYLRKYEAFGFTWSPENSSLGISVMGPMQANNLLMRLWLKRTHQLLDQRLRKMRREELREIPLHRTEIMASFLGPAEILIQSGKLKYKHIDGISTYGQTVFKDLFKRFSSEVEKKWLTRLNFTPLLFFHNSGVNEKWKSMSVREFLTWNTVMRELFRRSFSKCCGSHTESVNCLSDYLHHYIQEEK